MLRLKPSLSSSSSYQMVTIRQLGVGLHSQLLSWLRFCLALAYQGLVHAVAIAVSSYVQSPYCAQKTPYGYRNAPHLALMNFLPFPL